jgi:hypothetical protein
LTSAGTCVPLLQLLGKTLANPRVQLTRMAMTEAKAIDLIIKFIVPYSILDDQPALKG